MSQGEEVSLLTIEEVAGLLKASPETVLNLIINHLIPAIKLTEDEGYRIEMGDVKAFLDGLKQHTHEVALMEYKKTEAEKLGLQGLCNWLKGEKRELSTLYADLSMAMDRAAHVLYEELGNSQRSGEHGRMRGLQEALHVIQRQGERPKRSFTGWVQDSQERWNQALGRIDPETSQHLPALLSHWQVDLLAADNTRGEVSDGLALRHRPYLEAEADLYRKMIPWLQEDISQLQSCYAELDQQVEKTIHSLRAKAKKASKNMDFGRSQALDHAMNHLFQQWHKSRNAYHYWLQGQEERWQKFCTESRIIGS